jgi:hypothetical protein
MHERIAGFLSSRKGRDMVLVSTMLLLASTSFGLGRLSRTAMQDPSVALVVSSAQEFSVSGTQDVEVAEQGTDTEDVQVPEVRGSLGMYVASKKGTAYHLPWCSGAKRIAEENKVWFDSKEDAERAGYRPASNCKGI